MNHFVLVPDALLYVVCVYISVIYVVLYIRRCKYKYKEMKLEDARESCADATERRERCWRDAMKAQGRETGSSSSSEERYNMDRGDEEGEAAAAGAGGEGGLIMVDGTETCLVEELAEVIVCLI